MANPASADVSTDEAADLTVELEPEGSQLRPARHRSRRVFGAAIILAAASVAAFAVVATRDHAPRDEATVCRTEGAAAQRVGGVRQRRRHLPRPAGRGRPSARGRRIGYRRRGVSRRGLRTERGCRSAGVTGSSDTASSDAELVIVPVGRDGAIGAPTVIALDGFHALPGFDPHPCATWAPDGRWVAFGGTGEVWVVDTQTERDPPPARPPADRSRVAPRHRPARDRRRHGHESRRPTVVHAGHRLLRVDRRAPPTRLRRSRHTSRGHRTARHWRTRAARTTRRALARRRRRRQRTVARRRPRRREPRHRSRVVPDR